MKIFAKRTKKIAESAGPRTVNKSDPVVEELLKKDPSEWNAKERRMIKRYRDRKAEDPVTTNDNVNDNESTAATTTASGENNKTAESVDACKQEDIEDSKETTKEKSDESDIEGGSSSSSSSDDEDENVKGESNNNDDQEMGSDDPGSKDSTKKEEGKESNIAPPAIEKTDISVTPVTAKKEDDKDDDDGKVPKDHEIWSVLDKLNSKQKRTLSRKLDRLGKAVLDEVEQEANKMLDEIIPIVTDSNSKRDHIEATMNNKAAAQPAKKKRKKAADLSHLPPEERLRREEQRKKQQEAAARRARGEAIAPGHKHPLNSERRRANRRKPKWASKPQSEAPDISDYNRGHHTSGFLHRKNSGARPE